MSTETNGGVTPQTADAPAQVLTAAVPNPEILTAAAPRTQVLTASAPRPADLMTVVLPEPAPAKVRRRRVRGSQGAVLIRAVLLALVVQLVQLQRGQRLGAAMLPLVRAIGRHLRQRGAQPRWWQRAVVLMHVLLLLQVLLLRVKVGIKQRLQIDVAEQVHVRDGG